MKQLPPLNALRAFDAAARQLSFTRAAEELCVTHGAVSRQVAALEAHFCTTLFVRGPRTLTLTPEGQRLARATDRAFNVLRVASDALRCAQGGESSLLVSVPPSLAMWWLMPRLNALDEESGPLRVELSTSVEPVDFEFSHYDAAIRRVNAVPYGLYGECFLDGRSVPVCSPQYRARHRLDHADGMSRATLLVTRTESNAWDAWFHANRISRAPRAPFKVFDQLYLALAAATDSLGVALAPIALVGESLRQGKLCIVGPEPLPSRRAYALLCPRTSRKLDTVMAFGQWLKSQAQADRAV